MDTYSTGPEVKYWKSQARLFLGHQAQLFFADSHRLPIWRSNNDRVAVGCCMIIINDAWDRKAHP